LDIDRKGRLSKFIAKIRNFCPANFGTEPEAEPAREKYGNLAFVVLCVYPHKKQRRLELKIILSIENEEEPKI
jgi:hypothetical protein